MRISRSLLAVVFLVLSGTLHAQDFGKFEQRELVHRGDTLRYRILYPEHYDENKAYPLVLFLHGAGERGSDNHRQLTHGGSLFLADSIRSEFPSIVVFPQCPSDGFWSNVSIQSNEGGGHAFFFQERGRPTGPMALLLRLTKKLRKEEAVDQNRVYVGGLSMGAMGTFELLRRQPRVFAAAFAICGGDNTRNAGKYAHVPLWIFHGEKDNVVPPEHSLIIIDRLQQLGANPRYTFYPDADHNSWDPAFEEPDFIPWLFSNSK